MVSPVMKSRSWSAAKAIMAVMLVIVFIFPIYGMVVSSIKPNTEVFDLRLVPAHVSFSGYQYALKQNLQRYFLNSLIIASCVTFIALIFHSMSGYALARLDFSGKRFVFLWILSTLMIPFSVVMIPLFILVKSFGWLNSYWGVIVPAIPHAFGIFLFRQFYLTIPTELDDAATIDGCSPFGIYRNVYLPLSKPITMMLAVSFFIANWNNYLWPLIVNQEKKLWVLQVAIASFVGRNDTPWNAVMAASFVAVLPSIAIFFVLQKYLVEGIKMSGIK